MATGQEQAGVQAKRWTKGEYYRLGEFGFFRGQRVELIEGNLLVFSPQGPRHSGIVDLVDAVMQQVFGQGHCVRCQLPLDLGQTREPEPDIAVAPGVARQYVVAHPTTAALIVEVSDTTLSYDRNEKGSLYAASGIADYWIVNLEDGQVEVYRDPVPDPTQPFGHRYSQSAVLVPPAVVAPLALPNTVVAVADLLP